PALPISPRSDAEVGAEGKLQQRRDRRSRVVRPWDLGLERERVQGGVTPVLVEPVPFEAGAEPARAQLSRHEAQPVAGVLLDEIVRVVDGDDWCKTDVAVTDAEVQVAAPALLGVKDGVR